MKWQFSLPMLLYITFAVCVYVRVEMLVAATEYDNQIAGSTLQALIAGGVLLWALRKRWRERNLPSS
jgi:hypothetical protein